MQAAEKKGKRYGKSKRVFVRKLSKLALNRVKELAITTLSGRLFQRRVTRSDKKFLLQFKRHLWYASLKGWPRRKVDLDNVELLKGGFRDMTK